MSDDLTNWPPTRILVPLDFSEHSTHALRYAVEMASSVGAEVMVAHVGPPIPPVYSPLPEATAAQGVIWHDMLNRREAVLRKEMDDIVEPFRASGVVFTTAWRLGEPASALAEVALEEGIDLVVMGSHGRTGLTRALMGSVAERTARLCPCPVLIVR